MSVEELLSAIASQRVPQTASVELSRFSGERIEYSAGLDVLFLPVEIAEAAIERLISDRLEDEALAAKSAAGRES